VAFTEVLAVMLLKKNRNDKTDRQKMKKKSAKPFGYPFPKAKEVQPNPQASARLHHICFCPTRQYYNVTLSESNTFNGNT
jgi:hypothetical protein